MKTQLTKLGIVLAGCLVLTATHAAEPDPLKGRAYRGGLLRNGVFDAPGIVKLKGLKWKFPTGGAVKSSPVVVNGVAYFGSNDRNIYAVDVATGKLKWKVQTGDKVTGSAAVVDGVVYIASEDGRLYALDAVTGKENWVTRLGGGRPAGSPAVAHGIVFIGAGNSGGSEKIQMSNGPMVGLDVKTGRHVWKPFGGPQGYSSPAVAGTKMVHSHNAGFAVVELDVAARTTRRLGDIRTSAQSRDFTSPAIHNGIAIGIGVIAGDVVAASVDKGRRIWHKFTLEGQVSVRCEGESGYEIFGAPAIAHDRVYVGCNDGQVHTFGLQRGDRSWTFKTDGPVQSAPAAAGNVLCFGSHDGHLYAIDAVTGKQLWKFKTGGRIVSSPWPTGGVVYVGCDDGSLYAIEGEIEPPPYYIGHMPEFPVLMLEHGRRSRLIQQVVPVQKVANPVAALEGKRGTMAVIDASPKNLKALVAARDKLKAYTDSGKWLMLWGLTPQGLDDFNRLVGVKHMIRPFTAEEVDLPAPDAVLGKKLDPLFIVDMTGDPMLRGITREDIYMESGKWAGGNPYIDAPLRADDAWTYVVDTGDIGPWCTLPKPNFWNKTPERLTRGSDHFPRNMLNGASWHWRFGFTILGDEGEPTKWPITLPPNQKIVGFSISPGQGFRHITKIRLAFNDGQKAVDLALKETRRRQDFSFPARKATEMTFEIAQMASNRKSLTTSINNIWIHAEHSKEFQRKVKPLLNIGVLVKYPMGKGGILLNQMSVPEKETNPQNRAKKKRILQALLMQFRR